MNLAVKIRNQQLQLPTITTKVIQSINILQFNHVELCQFINEQAEKNPLIEIFAEPDSIDNSSGAELHRQMESATSKRQKSERDRSKTGNSGGSEPRYRDSGYRPGRVGSKGSDQQSNLEDYVAANITLRDHLQSQLGSEFRDPVDRLVAVEIIGSLDDDGYLRRDISMIADALGTPNSRVDSVLGKVQKMDPAGVAARDLAECLKLQLADRGLLSQEMAKLLDHLPLLADYEFNRLATICGVDVDEIPAMANEIKRLDPRPGRRFDCESVIPTPPDVTVKRTQDGVFVTELDARVLPRVLVNRQYYSEIRAKCQGADDIKFVADCLTEADWLVRCLDQRAQTVLRVATEIVSRQKDFLLHGVEYLKPLNLKDIADKVGIHQSTVCRAISNKYMMTDRGLYELKYFFATSIAAADGGNDFSADTVRHLIRQMISKETTADTVLSDDAIVVELRRSGVDIARRTVAKYREGMNIPSSLLRRRQKRVGNSARTGAVISERTPSVPVRAAGFASPLESMSA